MSEEELINEMLLKLEKSKFRNSFHLKAKEKNYIEEKGINVIRCHAMDFINKRLAPMNPKNDGSQTPMKGHPVFIAQHATSTCCRGCLYKWHHIKDDHDLTNEEINYIVNLIMKWIEKEMHL